MPEPFPERSRRECVKQAGTWRASRFSVPGCRVHSTLPVAPPSARSEAAPKLLFLVTEDWFFWSHRLPLARAARDAGFAVIVAARVRDHGERIREEGFILRPLAWKRRGDGLIGAVRAIIEIARLYRAERPDIVNHVALKPIVFGAIAVRLAFPLGAGTPARLAAVMGLGSVFSRVAGSRMARFRPLALALRLAVRGGPVTVENPENRVTLARLGVEPARIKLIRGSGLDTARYQPLADPPEAPLAAALVGRMLRSKGVLEAAAAIRILRAQGRGIELLLAGSADPDNRDSLSEAELTALGAEPKITWLGHVADVRTVWRRAAIALFPSTYGEGVPNALLEAAGCGRPIVATDIPGCREVVRDGETGLLVPPYDVARLAEAIGALAGDPARRQAMGQAGRALVEREFAEPVIIAQTLALYAELLRETVGSR
jgi:glycosyltransferase involved in cell wall biosynthesis